MDKGAWWATVYEIAKSQTRLSDLVYANFNFLRPSILFFTVIQVYALTSNAEEA